MRYDENDVHSRNILIFLQLKARERRGMKYKKVYVEVDAHFRKDGFLLPREIFWEDGQRFPIEAVEGLIPASSRRVGGQGDRYTVRIRGQERYLYFERFASDSGNNIGRWFVEGFSS